jgi:ribosome biogenesis GTPase
LRKDGDFFSPYVNAGYPVFFTSVKNGTGLEPLRDVMRDNVSVFAGPSGTGKSSLINWLTGSPSRETGELSAKIKRGRNTTRHTELLPLSPSGFCVDTPGFTSLDVNVVPVEDMAALFREFAPFMGQCRFSNCRHDKERDCAVKEQVGTAIHPSRYESYIKLIRR